MKTTITITSLLAATFSYGAESFGIPLFDLKPAVVGSQPSDWHAPLLPPEMLPAGAPNPAPAVGASSHPLSGPPATILGVSRAADKRSLTIQYELSGKTNEQTVVLTNGIAEFHFCSWLFDRGIALALKDADGEVYWAAFYFAGTTGPVYPRWLPSPSGHQLLGIANTVGDRIVISAINRFGGQEDRVSGWMYFNNCPPASAMFTRIPTNQIHVGGFEHLVEFEIPSKKSKKTK